MAIDFPNSPTMGQAFQGYVWDGSKWIPQSSAAAAIIGAVRYDVAQGLTAAQQSQARSNEGTTKKNYVINGAMQISQENGSTAGTTASGYYPVDQFVFSGSNAGAFSLAQVASITPSGSPNRVRYTVTTADASVGATDYAVIQTSIEGLRVADLRLGLASAKTVTLQFGVRAPAGIYSVGFENGPQTRSYVVEYVITSGQANTDVVVAMVIPGDVTGTWANDNTPAIRILWSMMCGSTYAFAAGSWQAVGAIGSPNQFNLMGTVGNVFELFDVGLYEGAVAPPFMVPDYASELAACRRYWWSSNLISPKGGPVGMLSGYSVVNTAIGFSTWRFPVSMRTQPTLSIWSVGVQNNVRNISSGAAVSTGGIANNYFGVDGGSLLIATSVTPSIWVDFDLQANARM